MFRPKASVFLPLLVAVTALSGCSANSQEENLVRQYFRASGLRDNQTLANFAVVSFDPKTEGVVTDFTVTSVSPEWSEPLKVIELSKAVTEAEAANKAFNEKKKAYQDTNMQAIERVLKAQASGRKLTGKDGQIQAEWEKWQADAASEAKKVSAARNALANSRPVAELSLTAGNGDTPSIDDMNGSVVSKEVNVAATVRGPDGATSQKDYRVTVQRAVVKGTSGDRNGKWVITAIKPV
ncbi:MAG TPA: hypothetical protein VJM31_18735 [Vicinamibacterales bacterium]|nr:hypothetical protein [Vicinamibacterales bacterium]